MSIVYRVLTITVLAVLTIVLVTKLLKWNQSENFVPYNNDQVDTGRPVGAVRDDEIIKGFFSQIIQKDQPIFGSKVFTNFKKTNVFEQETNGVINYVLNRINTLGNRNFKSLDTQSIKKEQTLDPEDRIVVTKWTVNLFIQEKNPENVHSWSTNINFVLLQKEEQLKITNLSTITDSLAADKTQIDGINPNDKYYKIMNPLYLNKPWKTSGITGDGSEVLMEDSETQQLLNDWQTNLKTPQYSCFSDNNEIQTILSTPTKDLTNASASNALVQSADQYQKRTKCDALNGKWDAPVTTDAECPYFQANKNYPNQMGGVKLNGGTWSTVDAPSGRCEMPNNTKTVGYRYTSPDPLHKPYCYNCKDGINGPGTWGPCCDQQRDLELYPQLGGNPDYAFPGDELERYQNRDVLAQRGLNWQKLPTHTKDILNSNQKQPVFGAVVGH